MLEAAGDAIAVIVTWRGLVLLLGGTVLGMLFGALPGLGGAAAVALIMPITFSWDPLDAFLLLGAVVGGTTFAGSMTAILINTPGESSNAATLLDGYPMARRGQASMAMGVSAAGSALGAIIGVALLIAVLPLSRDILLRFSYPETFMIAVVGLMLIAVVSRGSIAKGIISGAIGLLLAFVGRDVITGQRRYTFGQLFLEDGISFVPVLIGLFALASAVALLVDQKKPGQVAVTIDDAEHWQQVRAGIGVALKNPRVLIQSSVLGTACGLVPGVGGSIAGFLAYGTLKQQRIAQEGPEMGTGNPLGVLAPEAANDAKDGGALLPTIVFGLPGSATWAVVLGALLVHGITPGRSMLEGRLEIVFMLILSLLFSNILTSVIGLAASKWVAPIARLPAVYAAPVIFVIGLVGSYAASLRQGDVLVALVAGVAGYFLIKHGFNVVAIVIGLILGSIAEASLAQTMLTFGMEGLVTRPIALGILVGGVVLFTYPAAHAALDRARTGRRRGTDATAPSEERVREGEGEDG